MDRSVRRTGSISDMWLCGRYDAIMFIGGFTVLFVCALPITQIALGTVLMSECPAAPAIPVYVVVCGILALLMMGLFALPKLLCPAAHTKRIWILGFLGLLLFVFIWLIYGSYQIYSVYPPNYVKTGPKSSNSTPTAPDKKTGPTFVDQNHPDNKSNHTFEDQNQPDNKSNHTFEDQNQPDNKTNHTFEDQNHPDNKSNHTFEDQNQPHKKTNHTFEDQNQPDNKTNHTFEDQNQSDNKTNHTFEDQNQPHRKSNHTFEDQNLPNFNHTRMLYRNQTLWDVILNMSVRSRRETNQNLPPAHDVMAASPHCDRTLYLFAFWTTTLVYVFTGHALLIFCCIHGFIKLVNVISANYLNLNTTT